MCSQGAGVSVSLLGSLVRDFKFLRNLKYPSLEQPLKAAWWSKSEFPANVCGESVSMDKHTSRACLRGSAFSKSDSLTLKSSRLSHSIFVICYFDITPDMTT